MQLPHSAKRQAYVDQVKQIESELRHTTTESFDPTQLDLIQSDLDSLAERYQKSEEIGNARYKLYELQALIHFFKGNDDDALEFINQAIETRGENYKRAENIKHQLLKKQNHAVELNPDRMTLSQRRKRLIGLEGWLALFIVGSFISVAVATFRFFYDGFLSSNEIEALNQYQYGLGDQLQILSTLESIAVLISIGLTITMLVLLFKRRKIAKNFAIAMLLFTAIYGLLDYAIAYYVFDSANLTSSPEVASSLEKYAGDVGRSMLGAFIWTPYFLVSKRVKATLTK